MAWGQALEPPLVGLTRSLPPAPGTYGLALEVPAAQAQALLRIPVGALGTWAFPHGVYLYVGSAWGPGGLRARVGRHVMGSPRPRWHIDYLRSHACPVALWLAPGAHLECVWAQALSECPDFRVIIPRFGASDCRCTAHLFYLGKHRLDTVHLSGNPEFLALTV